MSRPALLADYPVTVRLPVQWGDQDAFGHVNNTVYIRWFESARVAYLVAADQADTMRPGGVGPILAAIHCDYKRQVKFPDTVHVAARVRELGRTSLKIAHAVYSEALGAIAAEGESVIVFFDYQAQRPRRVPEETRAAFARLEGRALANDEPT